MFNFKQVILYFEFALKIYRKKQITNDIQGGDKKTTSRK